MSHLNLAQIQELKEVMEEAFDDLVMTYLQDSDTKIKTLKKAIHAQDSTQIAEVAHSLKGSSANICAEALSSMFKKIEDAARIEELDQVPYVYDQILEEYTHVKTQLQQVK